MKVKQQVLRNLLKMIGATAPNPLETQHFYDILIKKQLLDAERNIELKHNGLTIKKERGYER